LLDPSVGLQETLGALATLLRPPGAAEPDAAPGDRAGDAERV